MMVQLRSEGLVWSKTLRHIHVDRCFCEDNKPKLNGLSPVRRTFENTHALKNQNELICFVLGRDGLSQNNIFFFAEI